jgi:hypothetical protein
MCSRIPSSEEIMSNRTAETRFNDRPTDSVPEVRAYQEAIGIYRKFREDNPEFFKYLDPLIEDVNTKLEAAAKAVRSKGISCGDFHLYQKAVKVDPDKIYDALGPQRFMEIGGTEVTVKERKISRSALDAALAQKTVKEEEIGGARTVENRYHQPEKIQLP